ncbi:jg3054, partial [Pararge aegeria aegeria]
MEDDNKSFRKYNQKDLKEAVDLVQNKGISMYRASKEREHTGRAGREC